MNSEVFWSCVWAILFVYGCRFAIVLTLVSLEKFLKHKAGIE